MLDSKNVEVSKMIGLVPTVRAFNYPGHAGLYYSLMRYTGLTFNTISAMFELNHGIIDRRIIATTGKRDLVAASR